MKTDFQPLVFGTANFWLQYFFSTGSFNSRVDSTLVKLRPRTFDYLVVEEIFRKEIYRLRLKKNSNLTIIDLGANIGLYSLWANEHYRVKKLVCVEPDSENFSLLKENLELNGLTNKTLALQVAISSSNGRQEFNKHFINKGMHELGRAGFEGVKTLTLASLIDKAKIDAVGILKIDIEGGEKYVFTPSNKEFFQKKVSAVVGEWHRQSDFDSASVRRYFSGAGFSFKVIEENKLMGTGVFSAVKK